MSQNFVAYLVHRTPTPLKTRIPAHVSLTPAVGWTLASDGLAVVGRALAAFEVAAAAPAAAPAAAAGQQLAATQCCPLPAYAARQTRAGSTQSCFARRWRSCSQSTPAPCPTGGPRKPAKSRLHRIVHRQQKIMTKIIKVVSRGQRHGRRVAREEEAGVKYPLISTT